MNKELKGLSKREYDVVVAGGGTGGVIAAVAAARQGAKTALIETKGYPGGIVVEGGTALHSFYNIWKAFPGVEKKQVVKGIPQEIIDRLVKIGGSSGHAEMDGNYEYDSVCTAIDTELYKLVAFEMLEEAGVDMYMNTSVRDALMDEDRIEAVIADSRNGRELFYAHTFIDFTGYGDLSCYAGAQYTEPNDHPVANSIGVAGVSIEKYYEFIKKYDALSDYSEGVRSGEDNKIIRLETHFDKLPKDMVKEMREIGMSTVTTSVHDDYFMFIKLNYKMDKSPTDRDAVTKAEIELRKRQKKAIEIIRKYIPGCEKAFITRTSPSLCIRRGRCIKCDYDITNEDIINARHFEDDVFVYSFHDCGKKYQVKDGKTYGFPYRAMLPVGIDNLFSAGMMITSSWEAHMSTRNTVSCMAQGQAVGTAAALCSKDKISTRNLDYSILKKVLKKGEVYFEK